MSSQKLKFWESLTFKQCYFFTDTIMMRYFLTVLLLCAVIMQTEARPRWFQRNSERPSIESVNESVPVFEIPESEIELSAREIPVPEIPQAVDGDLPVIELTAHILPPENIQEKQLPETVKSGRLIMGKGIIESEKLALFLLTENKNLDKEYIEELALFYVLESEAEGVNHDIAFAQMLLETGFLRFGGLVSSEQNNFCGLGATGPGFPGLSFPSALIGVRAHVQHLQAYAADIPLNGELVDPRYYFVRRGSVPEIKGLAGTWAADPLYADKIETILKRLYRFAETAD